MTSIERRSPVQFKGRITKSEVRDNWTVALAYADEGQGPFLVDLSHITRWDLQDKSLSRFKPLGKEIPAVPGACRLQDGTLINRMNRTQAAIWHLLPAAAPMPSESGYTEVTDATLCLALFGPDTLAVAEKLSALDFQDPRKQAPFLLQGPFSHIPCQLVVVERSRGSTTACCSPVPGATPRAWCTRSWRPAPSTGCARPASSASPIGWSRSRPGGRRHSRRGGPVRPI